VVDVSPGRAAPRVATSPAAPTAVGVPTQSAIDSYNQSAAAQAGQRENTKDTVILARSERSRVPPSARRAAPARVRSSVASWAPAAGRSMA
jgi:hypothetical protein